MRQQTMQTCDVLVIGSGAGGLSAAIAAGHSGADVIVVEAANKIGGATAYSGGQVWAGLTDPAREAGIEDSRSDVQAYLEWLSEGSAEPALRDVFIDRGPEAIRFLRDQGVPLTVVRHSLTTTTRSLPDRNPKAGSMKSSPGTSGSSGT